MQVAQSFPPGGGGGPMGAYALSPPALPNEEWIKLGQHAAMDGYPATILSSNGYGIAWPGGTATFFGKVWVNGNNEQVQVRINSSSGVIATSAKKGVSNGAVTVTYTGSITTRNVWLELWSYYQGSPTVSGQDKTYITITP